MNEEKLVVAVIRVNADVVAGTETASAALEQIEGRSRLAKTIEAAKQNDADIVIVMSDSESVLEEAALNLAVNRFVSPGVSNSDALALLADSDEGFIDDSQEVEFVWLNLA